MMLTITSIVKSLIVTAASAAFVAAVLLAAAGGHADHAATEEHADPVERQAPDEREAVMTNSDPRFPIQEPDVFALPGGVDAREE